MIYSLIEVVLPVFLVVTFGFLGTKITIVKKEEVDALLKFAQNIVIPIFLFLGMLNIELSNVFNWSLITSYYFGSVICFLISNIILKKFLNTSNSEAIALSFCVLFSNAVLLGLPITELAYGTDSIAPNLAIIAINAPLCYLIGISAMEIFGNSKSQSSLILPNIFSTILSNPIAMSLIFGLILNALGISLFSPVLVSLTLISKAAIPLALFALGGILAQYNISASFKKVTIVLILSLLVHPVITFTLATFIFQLEMQLVRSATITAAMAPGLNAFIFASIYKKGINVAAATIVIGTPISLFLSSLWISVL